MFASPRAEPDAAIVDRRSADIDIAKRPWRCGDGAIRSGMRSEGQRCRHVLLYGPPGAGKLATATALARLYNVRVLDNHLSVDPALRLFTFGTPEFHELVERLRVVTLRAAARAQLDIVSTLVYAHDIDDGHVRTLVSASHDEGAEVTMIQLAPSTNTLRQRLQAPSRAGTKKITDPAVLERMMNAFDLRTPYRSNDLTIDNSNRTVEDVARTIGQHAGLNPALDRQ